MKKLVFIFAFALVAVIFNSCNKPDDAIVDKHYVDAIQGQYIAVDGDIKLKAAPPDVTTRTWSMYARNSVHYGNVPYALVTGKEFITGSPAEIWWGTPGNNPASFAVNQGVYSNLTPDEDLRVICETSNAGGDVVYLAILDFNPDFANFPLTVNGFRLGDKLTINTDALTSLPGGNILSISVAFNTAPILLEATKFGPVTKTGGTPNGLEFQWNDIIYGPAVPALFTPITVPAGSGDFVLYEDFTDKVFGEIVITITLDGGSSTGDNSIVKSVPAQGPGKGLALKLTTTKVGWFDSQTIGLTDTDITIETVEVPVD